MQPKKFIIRQIIIFSSCTAIAIGGCFIGGFWGGVLLGAFVNMILLAGVGKFFAMRGVKMIDKKIRDFIEERDL